MASTLNGDDLQDHFAAAMAGFGPVATLAIAVSGGPDSMALLALAHDWANGHGARLAALTVDHQLRAEAKAEAQMVAAWCAAQKIPHHVLTWQHNDPLCGNLQAAARTARYQLIGDWCGRNEFDAVATAHHADDQAETLIMRLARGSGVDGLAAMATKAPWPTTKHTAAPVLLRPLLGARRDDLLKFAKARGLPIALDPSNEDAGFDRVATRRAITDLDLDVQRLTRTATLMGDEKAALEWATAKVLSDNVAVSPHGFVTLDRAAFTALPAALGARALRHLLQQMGDQAYPPRRVALDRLQQALAAAESQSLAGVRFISDAEVICVLPEHKAPVTDLPLDQRVDWDKRFSFCAGQAGWSVQARKDLSAKVLTPSARIQLTSLPASVRPLVPVLLGPDGQAHLPSFGESAEKVTVFNHLRAAFTPK